VRLAGVVVDGNLPLTKALMKIKGVGPRVAESLIPTLGLPVDTRVGSLSEEQISLIEKKFEGINSILPAWMLNRRKDMDTGDDIHRLGPELDMQKREDVNIHKKIKSYRGVRHSLNLPCRGQRTRSSFRTGTTIGVSRRKTKGTGK
jgi:small subunit ribosomal protein S13